MPLFHVFCFARVRAGHVCTSTSVEAAKRSDEGVDDKTREQTAVVRYHCSRHKHSNMGIKFHELAITGWEEETLAPDCTNISDRGKANVQ